MMTTHATRSTAAQVLVTPATLLAIDASSRMLGWCIVSGQVVEAFGEIPLSGEINDRCHLAMLAVGALLTNYPGVDVLAIESPVGRFTKAIIPQAFVSGAIRATARQYDRHVIDVPPAEAKQALTGSGAATKAQMQRAAAAYGVAGEHASDALGVGLAAALKVQVMR